MTDIVERLREACSHAHYTWQSALHNEAADEIERLRVDKAMLRDALKALVSEVAQDPPRNIGAHLWHSLEDARQALAQT